MKNSKNKKFSWKASLAGCMILLSLSGMMGCSDSNAHNKNVLNEPSQTITETVQQAIPEPQKQPEITPAKQTTQQMETPPTQTETPLNSESTEQSVTPPAKEDTPSKSETIEQPTIFPTPVETPPESETTEKPITSPAQSEAPPIQSETSSVQQETSAPKPESAPQANAQTGTLVGSVGSTKYHYPSCRWAKKILPENEIWFADASAAQANGYEACKICH